MQWWIVTLRTDSSSGGGVVDRRGGVDDGWGRIEDEWDGVIDWISFSACSKGWSAVVSSPMHCLHVHKLKKDSRCDSCSVTVVV